MYHARGMHTGKGRHLRMCDMALSCVGRGPCMSASAHVCCRELQCVAECCSVLQSVAVCCRVFQCVPVCCMSASAHAVIPDSTPLNFQGVLSGSTKISHYKKLCDAFSMYRVRGSMICRVCDSSSYHRSPYCDTSIYRVRDSLISRFRDSSATSNTCMYVSADSNTCTNENQSRYVLGCFIETQQFVADLYLRVRDSFISRVRGSSTDSNTCTNKNQSRRILVHNFCRALPRRLRRWCPKHCCSGFF